MFDYKNLQATYERLIVSDIQVDQQIDKLLEQNFKTLQITDRPTQLDDEVIIDYIGMCDAVQFDGGTAEGQPLTLGSGMFIPGFEEQLIGKSIGDEVDVHVTFPTEYHAPDLAGKAAIFKCKLHEIHVKQKYAADDTFALEIGGCESFEALRELVRKDMQTYADQQSTLEVKMQLMDLLCEHCECEFTEEQIGQALDLQIKALEAQLVSQSLSIELYCQFSGQTKEQLREDCLPDAMSTLKQQYIIAEIAKTEGLEADEASVAAEIERLCQQNNLTLEQLQPYFSEEFESSIVRSVIADKVLDLLVENADITMK